MNTIAASPGGTRLQTYLGTLVVALVVVAGVSIGGYGYRQERDLALQSAEERFLQLGRETTATMDGLFRPVESLIGVLAGGQLPLQRTLETRLPFVPALVGALRRNPRLSAIYVGYGDGAFFLVRALSSVASEGLGAPPGARYLVQHTDGHSSGVFIWLDADQLELRRDARPDYRFDPGDRSWYKDALASDEIVRGEPYVFFSTLEVGKTFSLHANDRTAVVGADFTLTAVSGLIAERTRGLDASALVVIFNDAGTVIAHRDPRRAIVVDDDGRRTVTVSELADPVVSEALRRAAAGETDRLLQWKDAGRDWRLLLARLPEAGNHAEFMAAAIPVRALLAPADKALANTFVVIVAILLAALPLAWLLARVAARPLERLATEAGAMRRFDFAEPGRRVESNIREIRDVGHSMAAARATIRRFMEFSNAIAAERDLQRLIERVLDESVPLASGAAGIVRLLAEGGRTLSAAAVRWPRGQSTVLPEIPLDGDLPAARAIRERRVTVETFAAHELPPGIAVATGDRDGTIVTVPLFDRRGDALGTLSIIRSGDGHRLDADDDLLSLLTALGGTLAVAIENQKLLQEKKRLLEALIQLVAGAIDAKSPYTAGHCQRVPVLTKMLVQAACDANEGPFASYSLSEEQWEAVHLGAWLHDCGKVTTPEYVVDKATKLETIANRLHEIRTRFEVLKRDADIAYWKRVAEGGDAAALTAVRDRIHRELEADFAFVAECNEGGEFMAPERIARLQAIGARTWTRTFDDRIGLSNDEKRLKAAAGSGPPPATEKLLDDKPEHVVPRPAADLLPSDNAWGFKVTAPEHKWNKGELYNLSVERGTLTEEERYVINDHIAQTIKMLTALPFPRHLRDVPEIAGGHHEKMDGTGYPKRLTREQMSLPARAMAIADIFEALTANDRPYKKAKTLSEAVVIMSAMKKAQHVDPELFDLFLKSRVYLRYAEAFCAPEQIDEVDVERCLAIAEHARDPAAA